MGLLKRLFGSRPRTTQGPEGPARRKKQRLALVGVDELQVQSDSWTVGCFPWSYTGEPGHVADYDVAVVNLLGLEHQGGFHGRGLPKEVDGRVMVDLLGAMPRLLISGGQLVVLGHPEVGAMTESQYGRHWTTPSHWTSMQFVWDQHGGDQVELPDESADTGMTAVREDPRSGVRAPEAAARFRGYLSRVSRYEYSLVHAELGEWFLRALGESPSVGKSGRRQRGAVLKTNVVAKTRLGGAVASEHILEMGTRPLGSDEAGWTIDTRATVVLLPDVGLSPDQSLALLLESAFGIHLPTVCPSWLNDLVAPGERSLLAQAEALRSQITDLNAVLRRTEGQRAELRRSLEALNKCDDDLERAVWELLPLLGAAVTEPTDRSKEDGWITVQFDGASHEGVLEIKGTRKSTFDEVGLRQLVDWVARGKKRGKALKGIFIGNSAVDRPPVDRGDPFGANFRTKAAEHGFAAITVAALVKELGRVLDDGASPDTFWRALFARNGVYGG